MQGVLASFHDEAARKYFYDADIELVECSSFRLLCESLHNKTTDFNLMAVENSIAGSILPNYLLLEQFKSRIIGEVYLRIEMQFMALKGQNIKELKTVHSHPMALFQCTEFLATMPNLQVIEAADTAESAKIIAQEKKLGCAAIASKLAAEVYDLEIYKKNIETDKQNYTRFLVVSRGELWRTSEIPNKTSLRFETNHRPGGLLEILEIFKKYNLNMTKLQSVPIIGKPYQYAFHVDLEWTDYDDLKKALTVLKNSNIHLLELGEYFKQERPV
ncbi:MAG: prephenate dehydratase [Bacteriovoracaceae bacterium]